MFLVRIYTYIGDGQLASYIAIVPKSYLELLSIPVRRLIDTFLFCSDDACILLYILNSIATYRNL